MRALFKSTPLTLEGFKQMLKPERVGSIDLDRSTLEQLALKHFIKFLEKLHCGQIDELDSQGKKLTLLSVYSFITGCTFIPINPKYSTLTYSFVCCAPNSVRRPVVSTCAKSVVLPLTTCKKDMEQAWVSALQDGANVFTRR